MIRLALLPESMFALSLLVTYLAHSTLWFLVAWAASHPGLGLSSSARSRIWRAALVGPLVGTLLALALADVWRVPAVELTLAPAPAPAMVPMLPPADLDPEAALPAAGLGWVPAALPPAPRQPPVPLDLGVLLLAAMVATGGCRLVMLGVRHLRFWRRLRGRRPVYNGPACERLRALAARADLPFPARLSISPLARGPMALGRGEICLPTRALDELPGPALSAVLAHELAHLERRDNGWLTAGAVIEAALFFQPLTRIARRQLSAAAELACDERAVELTDSPVDLARSIAIVAAWQLGRHEAVPVAAMARTPIDGDVVDRVKRLLAEPAPDSVAPAGRSRVIFGVLLACGLLAPAIGGPGELQAAGNVPMPLPKATQAANRFLDAPAVDEWNWEWDEDRPTRRHMRIRAPRAPRAPRPPMPPLAPMPPMPPMPPIPPMPASSARMGEVAGKMAQLGMKLAELHASRAGESFTEADQAKVKEVERQMDQLRKQLEVEENRFSRDMEDWGKRYEQQFGKDWQLKMEAWGQAYGQRMEEWQRRHGRDLKRWSRDFGRRMADVRVRDQDVRRRNEDMRNRQEEMRRRQDDVRRQNQEMRRHMEDARRQWEQVRRQEEQELRRRQDEQRKQQEELRKRQDEERKRQQLQRKP